MAHLIKTTPGKDVVFIWVSGHVEIIGNASANIAAKVNYQPTENKHLIPVISTATEVIQHKNFTPEEPTREPTSQTENSET